MPEKSCIKVVRLRWVNCKFGKKKKKTLLTCKTSWHFGLLICFSAVTHSIPLPLHEFWCQSLSNWASLVPAAGCLGGGRNQEFLAHESHFNTSTHLLYSISFFVCLPLFTRSPWQKKKERKRNNSMHGLPGGLNRSETLLSNSHQPCVNPQGDRENSKHRSLAKNKKCTVHPLSAACLLCKGPAGCQSRHRMLG